MRNKFLAALLACIVVLSAADMRANQQPASAAAAALSADQLDNLLASIALYPDPLLAQVLPASTFVDQIDVAARTVRGITDTTKIDKKIEKESWDVSVKAVAHYPQVISMMADQLDWTTAIGQAYVGQSTDVMASIQRLRMRAYSAGALVSSPQQSVVVEQQVVKIVPAQPQVIYVPQYNPQVVYVDDDDDDVNAAAVGLIAFGTGLAIGAWLNNDCDWLGGHVYYHGWTGNVGWVNASRVHVNVNSVYVNRSYTNVNVNRTVVNRNVNYNNISTYNNVNRNVNYNSVNRNANVNSVNANRTSNSVMNRNLNAADPRVDSYRKPHTTPATRPTTGPATQPSGRPATQPATRPSTQPVSRTSAQPAARAPEPRGFGEAKGRQQTAADSSRGKASRESTNRSSMGGGGREKPSGGGGGGGRGRRN